MGIGGLRGAISPPPGLSRTQGFARGVARGIPFYKPLNSLYHAATGTLGQWGDPANNPFNHPENWGGSVNPYAPAMGPAQGGTAPTTAGEFAGDPTDPNNPANYVLGPGAAPGAASTQPMAWTNSQWNAWRSPGTPTFQQVRNPGSAIGPWGGGTVNPYNPNSTHGTPNSIDTSIPGWAAASMAEVRKRHQP